jgi:pimeloyl-ACP methyl ester carboxylesterase
MDEQIRQRYWEIRRQLERAHESDQRRLMKQWADLLFDTDVYDPITKDLEILDYQYETNKKVWSGFVEVRNRKGALKEVFSTIEVPAIVIHGDFDPHPLEGIRPLLESSLRQVAFTILPECGHYPWIERKARDRFFGILRQEITTEH